TNFQGKWHISVSRVKHLSTSVEKLFCAMAATVEYHKKPTGTQSNLVKTSLGSVNSVLLRLLFGPPSAGAYLCNQSEQTMISRADIIA
ncbi:unnamed protein product, partial [Pocillopora meandrina]